MTPFWKSLATLLYGLICVAVPFMLGRWTKTTRYCGPCERRMDAAARARANGESVARLRERATSPDDVRRQAHEDRRSLLVLLGHDAAGLTNEQLRGIRL
jgi:hypothetical protein